MVALLFSIILVVFLNVLAWGISAILETDHFYDLTGGSSFLLLTSLGYLWGSSSSVNSSWRPLLATLMLSLWALRLSAFLFLRIRRAGHDKRLTKYLKRPLAFLVLWLAQAAWAICSSLPLLVLQFSHADVPLSLHTDGLLLALWAGAFAMQVKADAEKSAFRAVPANKGSFISTGLWAWCRHPNYLAQMLMSWSLSLFCLPGLFQSAGGTVGGLLAFLGPLLETYLLLQVSGIPLLEEQARAKWGDNHHYRQYVERTHVLIPCLSMRGAPAAKRRS